MRPNNKQRGHLVRHCGAARFAFNWGLRRRIDEYAEYKAKEAAGEELPKYKSSKAMTQHKQLNALKKTEFPWMYEVSKCAMQEALRDLDRAYDNFFSKRARFPRFKSKKKGLGTFKLYGVIKVLDRHVQLPRLGRIRLKETPKIKGRILSATVSERAGHWFVSFQVEEDIEVPKNHGDSVGVDLGIKTLATLSDGTVFSNPRALRNSERKLRRLQQSLSRSVKGSNRYKRKRAAVARLYYRISCQRRDALHKMTSIVSKSYGHIGIEDLNVSGMVKNRRLSKAIHDVSFFEVRRQLEYKAKWYGSEVFVHDRFYPSSKTCSSCGAVNGSLTLSERTFNCEVCGFNCDRDLNAAINLRPGVPRLQDVDGKALANCLTADGETSPSEASTEHRHENVR